jgi:predicted KAP-like P-loop ATPase
MSNEDLMLSSDKPVAHPDGDMLGYAPFAKHLAESITDLSRPGGMVVALFGQWGSGKTTILNLVQHYLNQSGVEDGPLVVTFNPWWFSGEEGLVRSFFSALYSALRNLQSPEASRIRSYLMKKVGDWGGMLNDLASLAEGVSGIPYVSGFAKAIKAASKRDVTRVKSQLAGRLSRLDRKILIVIDDIDRLAVEEMLQLFRVIKALADFPNVVYLLSFDRGIVASALDVVQNGSGEDYLEKVIQVSFEVPPPDRSRLHKLLFARLDSVLAGTPEALFPQDHWTGVFWQGLDHFIETPRDVVRLTNAMQLSYPRVKGEVNGVDFIAIEALRLFQPAVYGFIRNNQDMFAPGPESRLFRRYKREGTESSEFHNAWLEQVPDVHRQPVKNIVARLFPSLSEAWRDTAFPVDSQSRRQASRRICVSEITPVYFQLCVPDGDISNAEMQAILSLGSDPDAFGRAAVDLAGQIRPDGTTRARALLDGLESHTAEAIPEEHIPTIIKALFDVGDKLLTKEDERTGIFEMGNDTRIGRVIRQLLIRVEEETARFEILKTGVDSGLATSTVLREVGVLGQQHGRQGLEAMPEQQRLISEPHLTDLEGRALDKIRSAAGDGSLLSMPEIARTLYRWREWAGEAEPSRWIEETIETEEGLLRVLQGFEGKGFVSSASGSSTYHKSDPGALAPFVAPDRIIQRVRDLSVRHDLTPEQKRAVDNFIRGYEMMEQGRDPSDPVEWESDEA